MILVSTLLYHAKMCWGLHSPVYDPVTAQGVTDTGKHEKSWLACPPSSPGFICPPESPSYPIWESSALAMFSITAMSEDTLLCAHKRQQNFTHYSLQDLNQVIYAIWASDASSLVLGRLGQGPSKACPSKDQRAHSSWMIGDNLNEGIIYRVWGNQQ